jgi:hypothetical protein
MQRIEINNHVWEVPNEPGWEEVIKEASDLQQKLLSSCLTVSDCRRIIDQMHDLFLRYPVSEKYFTANNDDADDILRNIFKWG